VVHDLFEVMSAATCIDWLSYCVDGGWTAVATLLAHVLASPVKACEGSPHPAICQFQHRTANAAACTMFVLEERRLLTCVVGRQTIRGWWWVVV